MRLNPRLRKLISASRTASAPGFTGLRDARCLRRVGGSIGRQFQFVQNVKAPAGGQRQHPRRDFVQRVLADFLAAAQAKRAADSRVQQAQIIVNFGGCRDRRTRIARGILLADRNRRSDSGDLVHIRFLDALEELPRICRKRLDVAPLALGIKRVERKARLARTRHAADHRDRVVRDHEVNVLQVVDAGPSDANLLDICRDRLARPRRQRRRFVRVRRELPYGFRRHVYKLKIIRPAASGGKSVAQKASMPVRSKCPRRDPWN